MEWIIGVAVAAVVIVVAVIAQLRGWIDLTGKHAGGRGGGVAGLLGSVDEVFAPTRFEAQKVLEAQTEMPAPAPVPGDGDHDIFANGGTVRIVLDRTPPA